MIVGVLASAVAAFFYIRVIVLMFFSEPAAEGPTVAVPSIITRFTLTVAVLATVVLMNPAFDLADKASLFHPSSHPWTPAQHPLLGPRAA